MKKSILFLLPILVIILIGIIGVDYFRTPPTLSNVLSIDPEKVSGIAVRYESGGYEITDAKEIQEVIEHVDAFTYSYIIEAEPISGCDKWINIISSEKEYSLGFYCNAGIIRNEDVWYVGEENEYFMRLLRTLPDPNASASLEEILKYASYRGWLKKA